MSFSSSSTNTRPSTEVTCTTCKKQTTVPFVPTPGRPVYCRECFTKKPSSPGPRPAPRRGGRGPNAGGGNQGETIPRRRMLSQGRKGHFMYDARAVLDRTDDGMDEQHHRAFLEGLFARGARHGTDSAREFLDEKQEEELITADEHEGLDKLLKRYSEWR